MHEALNSIPSIHEPGMAVRAYNPNTQKVKVTHDYTVSLRLARETPGTRMSRVLELQL